MARTKRNFKDEVTNYLHQLGFTELRADLYRGTITIVTPENRNVYYAARSYRAAYESEVITAIDETINWINRVKDELQHFTDVHRAKTQRLKEVTEGIDGYSFYGNGLNKRLSSSGNITIMHDSTTGLRVSINSGLAEAQTLVEDVLKDKSRIEEYFESKAVTWSFISAENLAIQTLMRMR